MLLIVFGSLLAAWADENTPRALAAAIAGLARHGAADLRALGLQTSASVRQRYAWNHVFDRLFTAYREVVADALRHRDRLD